MSESDKRFRYKRHFFRMLGYIRQVPSLKELTAEGKIIKNKKGSRNLIVDDEKGKLRKLPKIIKLLIKIYDNVFIRKDLSFKRILDYFTSKEGAACIKPLPEKKLLKSKIQVFAHMLKDI